MDLINNIGAPLWGFLGIAIGAIATYLTNKNKNSSSVEIAKINSSSSQDKIDIIKLKSKLSDITEKYKQTIKKYQKAVEENEEKAVIIKEYEYLLKSYKFVFKLTYELITQELDVDSGTMVLLDEVKEMFAEDYKI